MKEVDNHFNDIFGEENKIKESDKLSNKIKKSLEKGKIIQNKWNEIELNSLTVLIILPYIIILAIIENFFRQKLFDFLNYIYKFKTEIDSYNKNYIIIIILKY